MKTSTSLILACLLVGPSLCLASPEAQVQEQRAAHAIKPLPVHKTHYYEARRLGKKFVFWRLVRGKDAHVHNNVYPYGTAMVSNAGPIKKYGVLQFHALLNARRKALNFKILKPGQKANAVHEARLQPRSSSVTYQTNLPLGYNPSTGYVPTSNCFNSTTALYGGIQQLSFNSSNTASSVNEEINVSGSIIGNIQADVASASTSDFFTYGNQYSASSQAGSYLFTAYQLYSTTNNFYSLNTFGQQQTGDTFSYECGSNFVASLPVGMLITGQASYSSSSITAAQEASNQFALSASGGALSTTFSAAVSAAYSATSSSTGGTNAFGFTSTVFGGGEGAASTFSTGAANAVGLLASCSEGVTADCDSYVAALNDAAATALKSFATYANTAHTDLSFLAPFPNGLDGVTGLASITHPQTVAQLLNSTSTAYADAYTNLSPQLKNYLTIINEISTLYSRVSYLSSQLSTPNGVSGFYSTNMDLSPMLPIANSYLGPLATIYSKDIQTMVANANACITATSSTSATVCAPVNNAYNNGITSAYAWYNSTSNGNTLADNNYALQNTIALQYTGQISIAYPTSSGTAYRNWGLDMIWATAYPVFTLTTGLPTASTSAGYSTSPPSGYPGIIAFADQPYTFIGATGEASLPYVMLIPNTSTSISSFSTPATNYSAYNYNISQYGSSGGIGWQVGSGGLGSVYYNGCSSSAAYPTFANPCTIYTTYTSPSNTNFPGSSVSATFTPISNFFGS